MFYFPSACEDGRLSDLTSKQAMESNGWAFVGFTHTDMNSNRHIKATCETSPNTWYGYCKKTCNSSVSAIFQDEDGTATLGYGQCWRGSNSKRVTVEVTLNGLLIDRAIYNQSSKTVTFPYQKGDVLEIKENYGIIKLNFLQVGCAGKYR